MNLIQDKITKLPIFYSSVDQLPPAPSFPEGNHLTTQHRELDRETNRTSNSRGTTFVIVVVVALLISSLFVGLAFLLCLRLQRIRRRQSLKKITSSSECHQPMGGISSGTIASASMEYPTSYSSRIPCQQTQIPTNPAYVLNGGGKLYNPSFPMYTQSQAPLSVFGTSMEHGGLPESSLGPAGTAFHGLSSPG